MAETAAVSRLRTRFTELREPLLCIGGLAVDNLMFMAKIVMRIPRDLPGIVVECGSGASTINFSIICKLVGRQMCSFDSFTGLPDDGGRLHHYPYIRKFGYYRPGILIKSVAAVQTRIDKYGSPEVCTLVQGLFQDTLKGLHTQVVFAFLDVDLVESTRECLQYIWPLLIDGGYVFTHDAINMDCVRVFFDEPWWQKVMGCGSPGFVGSGCGLKGIEGQALGYTQKISDPEKAGWKIYKGLELERREQALAVIKGAEEKR